MRIWIINPVHLLTFNIGSLVLLLLIFSACFSWSSAICHGDFSFATVDVVDVVIGLLARSAVAAVALEVLFVSYIKNNIFRTQIKMNIAKLTIVLTGSWAPLEKELILSFLLADVTLLAFFATPKKVGAWAWIPSDKGYNWEGFELLLLLFASLICSSATAQGPFFVVTIAVTSVLLGFLVWSSAVVASALELFSNVLSYYIKNSIFSAQM